MSSFTLLSLNNFKYPIISINIPIIPYSNIIFIYEQSTKFISAFVAIPEYTEFKPIHFICDPNKVTP